MQSTRTLFSADKLSTKQTLTLIGLAGLTSLILVVVPIIGLLDYPFRLMITLVHELGHGLAAILTGGSFLFFEVFPNGGGLAHTSGGLRFVVIPAGYLGAALFGAILILLGRSHRWSRVALGVIGGAMVFLSLRYGIPSLWNASLVGGTLATITGLLFGTLLVWVAIKASPGWIVFFLHLIAIQAVLMSFSDLMALVGLSSHFFTPSGNDAQSMTDLTLIPAFFWAQLWAIIALALIGGAIWFTWLRPSRRTG